ncbi:MAG: peptidylprolyl isomerase [Bacteroidota bacterium]
MGDSSVIATVGRFAVTEGDLLRSFEAAPAFVRRDSAPLQKHLEYMMDERLLALAADSLGFSQSGFVKERVSALEEDLAVDELYKADILSHVRLGEREIEANMQKAVRNVRYRWIFAPERRHADALLASIRSGAPFDSLFQRELAGSSVADRTAESTQLRLEWDTPNIASALGKLRKRGVSPVLEGNDGFYIVSLDEVWQNPLRTETEMSMIRGEAIRIGTQIKADARAGGYVKSKMRQANPVLKAGGFNILRAFVAEKGLSRDTRVRWAIPATFMTEAGPQPIAASSKFLNRPLVTFGKRTLTVSDYTRWFDLRQFQLKTHSLSAFNSSVKQTVWRMVQDKLLIEEAYRRGFQTVDTVRHETAIWEAKFLYLAGRAHVLKSASVDESHLRSLYDERKKQFRRESQNIPTFESVKEEMRAEALGEQEGILLLQALEILKARYPVVVNKERLSQLSRTSTQDRQAIDMIIYKPGGTFPRVAFPTIDEAWSRLQ